MPVNADSFFPFDAGAGANVTEDQWRRMAEFWLRSGVLNGELNGLAAFGDGSGLHVKVPSGKAWVKGHYGEWTSQNTIALAAVGGIPGGQSRIDRIIVRADFAANRVELDNLTGTPAGSPSPPTLTQSSTRWEISLAQVTGLTNATTVVTAGMVVDERPWATPFYLPSLLTYTPTLTASSTNPTLGTGSSVNGEYVEYGKLVVCWGNIAFGSSGVNAGNGTYFVSAPTLMANTMSFRRCGVASLFDSSATAFAHPIVLQDGTNQRFKMSYPATWPAGSATDVTHAAPWAWAASDSIAFVVAYVKG